MPFIDLTDTQTMHYEESGTGFPLVLVHGWGMSARVWAFQAELAASYRLIALDLRGHGRSSALQDRYAFPDLASDLVALFDRLGIERAALAGWSLGAQVALESAPLLGERLAALVLIGGTPRFTVGEDWPHGLPAMEIRGLAARLRRDYDRTLGEFFQRMFAEGELTGEDSQRIAREIVVPRRLPDPRAVHACLATLAEGDQRGLLPLVQCPTLVVHGDEDSICLPAAGRFMAERLPAGRFVSFAGVGHAPFLSRPAAFNRLVAPFLREVCRD